MKRLVGLVQAVLLWLCLASGRSPRRRVNDERGLIVIPGVGRADRLTTVLHNLHIIYPNLSLQNSSSSSVVAWDCVLYVYAPHEDTSFWSPTTTSILTKLAAVCSVIENPRKKCTENLHMAQPALLKRSYQWVFVLLDDIKLPSLASEGKERFSLQYMVDLMRCNSLSVLSPKVNV